MNCIWLESIGKKMNALYVFAKTKAMPRGANSNFWVNYQTLQMIWKETLENSSFFRQQHKAVTSFPAIPNSSLATGCDISAGNLSTETQTTMAPIMTRHLSYFSPCPFIRKGIPFIQISPPPWKTNCATAGKLQGRKKLQWTLNTRGNSCDCRTVFRFRCLNSAYSIPTVSLQSVSD